MSERLSSAGDQMPASPRARPMAPAAVLSLAVCLTQFDVTAAAVALPAIRDELGFSLAAMAWVMDAYSLAFAGCLFVAGAVADRFGRRRALLAGNAVFALASLVCGLAWDGPALWAGRALQGAAAAFFITGGFAAVSLAYPPAMPALRARAFGIIGVTGGAAMALGPTLGGLIAAEAGWRWIFLLNLPVCLASDFAVRRVLVESRDMQGRPLDLPGVLLLTLAIVLPVQGLLQQDGIIGGWGGVAAGLFCAILLVLQQRRRPQPMLDPALFAHRAPLGIIGILVSLSVGYWAVLVFLPVWLQPAFGLGLAQTGYAMLAVTLPMLALPPAGIWLTARHGWRANFTAGMALLSSGMALLSWVAFRAAALEWALEWALAAMALAAAGAGLSNAQVSGALVALAPPARAGMAAALATTLRQAGYAIGIALLGVAAGGGGFALSFTVAAAAAAFGALAAFLLLDRSLG